MPFNLSDRILETTTSTGTGPSVVLPNSSPIGYRPFLGTFTNNDTTYYCIEHQNANEWEVGFGSFGTDGISSNFDRTTIIASSNSNSAVNFSAGTKNIFVVHPAELSLSNDLSLAQGRLTLTSATPITTGNVSGAGTLYYTPYIGERISVFTSSRWKTYTFSELSLSLTLTSGKNYDVFIYDNSGTLTLELSSAWTNDTTRDNALTTLNSVYVKSGATTRRWLGCIRASGTNTTEDSLSKRFVWNAFNRVRRPMYVFETTDTWTYSTSSYRQMNNSTNNQLSVICGIASWSTMDCFTHQLVSSTITASVRTAIGIDATNAVGTGCFWYYLVPQGGQAVQCNASLSTEVALGYHYYAALEYGGGSGTQTWYGDAGVGFTNGIRGTYEC